MRARGKQKGKKNMRGFRPRKKNRMQSTNEALAQHWWRFSAHKTKVKLWLLGFFDFGCFDDLFCSQLWCFDVCILLFLERILDLSLSWIHSETPTKTNNQTHQKINVGLATNPTIQTSQTCVIFLSIREHGNKETYDVQRRLYPFLCKQHLKCYVLKQTTPICQQCKRTKTYKSIQKKRSRHSRAQQSA